FADAFARLDRSNLHRLDELYGEDVRFADPLHEVHGLAALRAYFEQLYANLDELRFDFHGCDQVREGEGYLRWTLHYRHPRLNRGAPVAVSGCSHLHWADGKVQAHRDYFDAGALLYEQLPLLR